MKLKSTLCSLLAATLVSAAIVGCASSRAALEAEAKVSRADAEKIALAKVPGGTIKEADLEKEKGRLIWSFDIATPGTKNITEVQVDAITGAIVSVETETPEAQEKERKDKEKEKK